MTTEKTEQVLAQTSISGLDIAEALGRMGNNPKLYMRIIHSFVANMPANLETLSTEAIVADTLEDYAITIHGVKGSCYGIGANVVGDKAKELELAAKAGDLDTCLQHNDGFLEDIHRLVEELKDLEAAIDRAESEAVVSIQAEKPDTMKLAALLVATQSFDIDEMNRLIDELASVSYVTGSEVVETIKKASEAFDYKMIEDTIASYL